VPQSIACVVVTASLHRGEIHLFHLHRLRRFLWRAPDLSFCFAEQLGHALAHLVEGLLELGMRSCAEMEARYFPDVCIYGLMMTAIQVAGILVHWMKKKRGGARSIEPIRVLIT
jgi:hypothetical protein